MGPLIHNERAPIDRLLLVETLATHYPSISKYSWKDMSYTKVQ